MVFITWNINIDLVILNLMFFTGILVFLSMFSPENLSDFVLSIVLLYIMCFFYL